MTSPNTASEKEYSIEEQTRAEFVRLLYSQTPVPIILSLFVGLMIFWVLWDVTEQSLLINWFSIILIIAVIRLYTYFQFKKRNPGVGEIESWDRFFIVSIAIVSITWGAIGWYLMPENSILHQAFIWFILMGMAGAGVGSYNARLKIVMIVTTLMLLPMGLWFLTQDGISYQGMSIGILLFIVSTYRGTKNLEGMAIRSFQLTLELEIANKASQQLARTDDLTQLNNRRAFYELGEVVFNTAKRHEHPLSVVMFDINNFKHINDTWGHIVGDQALKALANIINASIRNSDIAGRYGGDEFAILLPNTPANEAATQLERLEQAVGDLTVHHDGTDIIFTCSFGVAELNQKTDSLEALIGQADQALYQAKEKGGNTIVVYSPQ